MAVVMTMTASDIRNELMADEYAGWSYEGAGAIASYLEDLSDDLGEDIQFNRVDIRCEYSEYRTIADYNAAYDEDNEDWDDVEDVVATFDGPDDELSAIVRDH